MMCQHCQKKKANRPRGLCWRCYYAPGVRQLYGGDNIHSRAGMNNKGDNLTAAEIEQMVAEQLPTMPTNDEEPDPPKRWQAPLIQIKPRRVSRRRWR